MFKLTRRQTIQAAPLAGLVFLSLPAYASELKPTAACDDNDDAPTSRNDEGPFFKAKSPQRKSLIEAGLQGDKLTVTGLVLTTGCRPIANAVIDFWQADHEGVYDNEGFRLRGHQITTNAGEFNLETIWPGLYPGRTRHIHVKVAAPGAPILTTQLYFPNERFNARDGLFRPDLLVTMAEGSAKAGRFDFIIKV